MSGLNPPTSRKAWRETERLLPHAAAQSTPQSGWSSRASSSSACSWRGPAPGYIPGSARASMAAKSSSTCPRVTFIRSSSPGGSRAIRAASSSRAAPVSGSRKKRVQRRCSVSPRPIAPCRRAWNARWRRARSGATKVSPSRNRTTSPLAALAPALDAPERPRGVWCRTRVSGRSRAAASITAAVWSPEPSSTTTTSTSDGSRLSEASVSRSRSASSLERITTLRLTRPPPRRSGSRGRPAPARPLRRPPGNPRRSGAGRRTSAGRRRLWPRRRRRR